MPGFVVYISGTRPLPTASGLSITPDRRKTLVFSRKSQETCLQGSPPVHVRRHECGSRTVPFGSLRLPRMPLGGFGTSRSPLAAVAALGAGDNKNDDVENVDKVLFISGIFLDKCCLGATLL